MIGLIVDIVSLVLVVLVVLWAVWYAVRYFWPSAEATIAGQFVGKLTDTTQAYTMYGLLETMKIDNKVKADANALGAITYLQSVVLRGVASDWTKPIPPMNVTAKEGSVEENPADANADSIDWSPPQ